MATSKIGLASNRQNRPLLTYSRERAANETATIIAIPSGRPTTNFEIAGPGTIRSVNVLINNTAVSGEFKKAAVTTPAHKTCEGHDSFFTQWTRIPICEL